MPASSLEQIVSLAQAPRVRLSVVGRLRRPRQHLGLRSAGRRAEEQRQARLVALGRLRPRRHGGARRRHPDEPAGLEVLGPRGDVLGSDDRLPQLQGAPARRPRVRGAEGARPQGPGRDQRRHRRQGAEVPEVRRHRSDRGAAVQPDVQDHRRRRSTPATTRGSPTCGPRRRRGSSSTSATCSTPCAASCRSASPRSARRSATRSRRATSPSARASSSRWRSSTSCEPGEDEAAHQAWIDARTQWYVDLGHAAREPAPARAGPRTSWPTTPSAASISSTASRWGGASSRGSPTAPTSI